MKNQNKFDIVLINPPYHRRLYSGIIFPLGLGYLYAALSAEGFSTKIIDCSKHFSSLNKVSIDAFQRWLDHQLEISFPFEAIGVGPCTTSAVRSLKIISEICKKKYPETPLIYGGPLASIPGQEDLFFDEFSASAIVPGDGEQALCEILNALKRKQSLNKIEGISTKLKRVAEPNIIKNLDSLPFPYRPKANDNNLYKLSTKRNLFLKPFTTMLISRGCPYSCSYCVSGILRNGLYHRRSIENIIKEIDLLTSKQGIKSIVFYDDTFFPSPNTLENDVKSFSDAFNRKPYKFKWQIEIRPDVLIALNKSLIKLLYNAGCAQINIGIEKANSWAAKPLNKIISPELIRSKCQEINTTEPEMRITGTFILGGPQESVESIKETIEFSKSLRLLYAHFYPLEIYPGTEMYENKFKNKEPFWWYQRIISDDLDWGEIIYETDALHRDTLLHWISIAYDQFYNRKSWRSLSKRLLGKNYFTAEKQVLSWIKNRFQLGLSQ